MVAVFIYLFIFLYVKLNSLKLDVIKSVSPSVTFYWTTVSPCAPCEDIVMCIHESKWYIFNTYIVDYDIMFNLYI